MKLIILILFLCIGCSATNQYKYKHSNLYEREKDTAVIYTIKF